MKKETFLKLIKQYKPIADVCFIGLPIFEARIKELQILGFVFSEELEPKCCHKIHKTSKHIDFIAFFNIIFDNPERWTETLSNVKADKTLSKKFIFPYLAKLTSAEIDFCHSLSYPLRSELLGTIYLEPLAVSLYNCIVNQFSGKETVMALKIFEKLFLYIMEDLKLTISECGMKKINKLHNKPHFEHKQTYLIIDHNTNLYKIGRSNNPFNREKTLQGEKPTLQLIKIWPEDIEMLLHRKYKDFRIRGEWFKLEAWQITEICKTDF